MKRNDFHYTKTRVYLAFAGCLGMVGLSFVLGLMYGYHLASSSFEEMLPSKEILAKQLSKRKDITFYEVIKQDDPIAKVLNRKPLKKKSEQPVNHKKGKKYKLQIAAFLRSKRAENLSKKLISQGFNSEIVRAKDKKGKLWHKVQIIDINGRKKAKEIVSKVKKSLGVTPIMIQIK